MIEEGYADDRKVNPGRVFARAQQDDLHMKFQSPGAARRVSWRLIMYRWRHKLHDFRIEYRRGDCSVKVISKGRYPSG